MSVNRYRLGLLNLLRLQLALQMPITDLWPPVGLKAERVTCNILSAVLSDAEEQLPARLTVEDIIGAVCEEFGFTPAQLAGPSRERRCSRARCLAAALARKPPLFWEQLRRIEKQLAGKMVQKSEKKSAIKGRHNGWTTEGIERTGTRCLRGS